MFDYTVSKDNSPAIFADACNRIRESFPDYIPNPLLVDVDGSTIQVFYKNGASIKVYDDYDIGAVFVISDIDLNNLFGKYIK